MKKKFNLFKWFFDDNPLFSMLLGMCSTLAITTTFENAFIMGLSVTFVLILTSIIVSLISKYISEELRISSYVIIIATLVTVLEVLLKKYSISVYESLGVYFPLITVNCIILGKVLSFASKNKVGASILDSLKTGIQYTFAIVLFASIREILGNNSLTIISNLSNLLGFKLIFKIFPNNILIPSNIFLTSAGAFITLGVLLGILNSIKNRGDSK